MVVVGNLLFAEQALGFGVEGTVDVVVAALLPIIGAGIAVDVAIGGRVGQDLAQLFKFFGVVGGVLTKSQGNGQQAADQSEKNVAKMHVSVD